MKNIVLIVSIWIAFTTASMGQGMTGHWSFTKVSEDTCTQIDHLIFADSLTGYLCTKSNYKPILSNPITIAKWYRTLDGGYTWNTMSFNGLSEFLKENLFALQYSTPSPNSIYLAKNIAYPDRNKPTIVYSVDRGSTWDSVETSLDLSQYFTMFTQNIGIGLGNVNTRKVVLQGFQGPSSISRATGDSMFNSTMTSQKNNFPSSPFFTPTTNFSNQANGCIVTVDNSIENAKGLTTIITTDGGSRWQKYHSSFPQYQDDTLYGNIQFEKNSSNLWLSLYSPSPQNVAIPFYYGISPKFNLTYMYSSDYGKSWSTDSSFSRRRAALWGTEAGNVWMLLYKNKYENEPYPTKVNIIAHTIDYGKTWDIDTTTLLHVSDFGDFEATNIYCPNKNIGWIAAINNKRPYVFRYTPNGVNSTQIEHAGVVTQRIDVYPNPASTKVNLSLPDYLLPLHIEIYDILGRKKIIPYTIENANIQIDTRELVDGIWIVLIAHQYGSTPVRFIKSK